MHGGTAQRFGTPPAPHTSPSGHVPQLAVSPPQPFAIRPQVAPASVHVRGSHGLSLHVNRVPSAPHTCPVGHVPQLIAVSPHPSPISPHVAPSDAHVTSPHAGAASGVGGM